MTEDYLTWQEHVEKSEAHKALGHTEIYLDRLPLEQYPWHLVESCEPGGSHRIAIATDVWFRAKHRETGLKFRWSFDIEPPSANGKPGYEFDVDGINKIMPLLPEGAANKFRVYLKSCAAKVRKQGAETIRRGREYEQAADCLEHLSR